MEPTWKDFLAGWTLFRDPILTGMGAGLVLGYLGVFVVVRRMVFVSAALTQAAALGVATSFLLQLKTSKGSLVQTLFGNPLVGGITLTLLTSVLLVFPREKSRFSRESLLGLVFLLSNSLAILVGSRIQAAGHDISSILFGTAVMVSPRDMKLVLGVGAFLLLLQLWWRRGFVFVSTDPTAARVQKLPVRWLELVMFLSMGLMISITTRALGALPVFAFMVLPAMGALWLSPSWGVVLWISALTGMVVAGAGYIIAFFWKFPVGATQSTLAAVFVLFAFLLSGVFSLFRRFVRPSSTTTP